MDPLAEESRRLSPFTYVQNDPVRLIDPDGMMDNLTLDKASALGQDLAFTATMEQAQKDIQMTSDAGKHDGGPVEIKLTGYVLKEVTVASTRTYANDIPVLHRFLTMIGKLLRKKHKDSSIPGGTAETQRGGNAPDAKYNPNSTKGHDALDITDIVTMAQLFQESPEPQPQSKGLDLLTKGTEAVDKALETKDQIEDVNDAVDALKPGPEKPETTSKPVSSDSAYIDLVHHDTISIANFNNTGFMINDGKKHPHAMNNDPGYAKVPIKRK